MPIFRGSPQLLRGFREGRRDALEQVYRAYVDNIANLVRYGFTVRSTGAVIRGLGFSAHEVADTVQDIFAKSFSETARRSYDGVRDYGPYLYAIARNVIADRLRKTREVPTPWRELEQARELEIEANRPADAWADPAVVAAVREYLGGLNADLRRVHEVRYVEGLSQRVAAGRLGVGVRSIRTLEEQLRKGLRQELRRRQLRPGDG